MGEMVGDALTLFCMQKSLSDQHGPVREGVWAVHGNMTPKYLEPSNV